MPDPDHATKGKFYKHAIPQDAAPGIVAPPDEKKPIEHEHTHHDPDSPEMKRIGKVFDWIVSQTAELLGNLNEGIKEYGATPASQAKYEAAQLEFNRFLDAINDQNQTVPFAGAIVGPTMIWAVVEPVMKEKYIYGAKIYAKWLGGTHSSSSGVAIQHP
jgi:hypothetical protein